MCVICIADRRKPNEEELQRMAHANGDGGGIGYRKDGLVHWEKGLEVERVIELVEQAELPFVVHFRIASCGGRLPELTHPFPVERDMRTDLSGATKGFVLFHNGHWGAYRERGLDGAIKNKVKVPAGRWSDTRVMAWLAHMHGPHILEFLNEKIILFGPENIQIFNHELFVRVNDLLVSNRSWEHGYSNHGQRDWSGDNRAMHMVAPQRQSYSTAIRLCRLGNCKEDALEDSGYCAIHQPACRMPQCSVPRLFASEFCEKHQPPCAAVACQKARIVGERHCKEHLAEIINAATGPRGSQPPAPFRGSDSVVQGEEDQQGAAESGQKELGAVGGQQRAATRDNSALRVLLDKDLQEQSRWARSINSKPYTRGPVTQALLKLQTPLS